MKNLYHMRNTSVLCCKMLSRNFKLIYNLVMGPLNIFSVVLQKIAPALIEVLIIMTLILKLQTGYPEYWCFLRRVRSEFYVKQICPFMHLCLKKYTARTT